MELSKKGWLKDYLEYRSRNFDVRDKSDAGHPDFALYYLLQPTGILYGRPVQAESIGIEEFNKLDLKDRMKILLAEGLINVALLQNQDKINDIDEFNEIIGKSIGDIAEYYHKVYPEVSGGIFSIFSKKKSNIEAAEKIIEQRVSEIPKAGNFWIYFFHNILVFLDIYFFGQWIHSNEDDMIVEYFKQEKEDLRLTVITIVVAAAHANNILEIEEKKLFGYLVKAARLSSSREKEAWGHFDNGIDVEAIKLPDNNSWLLKKYFLEVAILTVWADRKVDSEELDFLKRLTTHLSFFEDDLDKSLIAIEGFVLAHWFELSKLQSSLSKPEIEKEYELKIGKIIDRNRTRVLQLVNENEAVTRLIGKFKDGNISNEDRDRLRGQLASILAQLPSLKAVGLPTSYLTLDIVVKVLPKEIFDPT